LVGYFCVGETTAHSNVQRNSSVSELESGGTQNSDKAETGTECGKRRWKRRLGVVEEIQSSNRRSEGWFDASEQSAEKSVGQERRTSEQKVELAEKQNRRMSRR